MMAYTGSGLAFSTIGLDGVNLALTQTISTSTPEYPNPTFSLGQVARAVDGSEYVFVKAAQATAVGVAGYLDTSWNFTSLTSANAAGKDGAFVAVNSQATFASGDYGWVQVKGGCPGLNVAANTLAFSPLYTSATAGQLTSTPGGVILSDLELTVAASGSAGSVSAILNYPTIGGSEGLPAAIGGEVITALNTVGAGTITAAGINGGVTARGGAQAGAAFTDTTDTAANISAAAPALNLGQSWEYTYQNNTNAAATLTGGTGVTVSGLTVVPPTSWARFLVTYTAANTFTVVGIAAGPNVEVPPAQYATAALQSATMTAAEVSGAAFVAFDNTGTTPANLQMPTAAAIVANIPNCQAGFSYMLAIRNDSGSANTATITTNTGITLTGTMTIAQNVTRLFVVTVTSLTAVTVQSIGVLAAAA